MHLAKLDNMFHAHLSVVLRHSPPVVVQSPHPPLSLRVLGSQLEVFQSDIVLLQPHRDLTQVAVRVSVSWEMGVLLG